MANRAVTPAATVRRPHPRAVDVDPLEAAAEMFEREMAAMAQNEDAVQNAFESEGSPYDSERTNQLESSGDDERRAAERYAAGRREDLVERLNAWHREQRARVPPPPARCRAARALADFAACDIAEPCSLPPLLR